MLRQRWRPNHERRFSVVPQTRRLSRSNAKRNWDSVCLGNSSHGYTHLSAVWRILFQSSLTKIYERARSDPSVHDRSNCGRVRTHESEIRPSCTLTWRFHSAISPSVIRFRSTARTDAAWEKQHERIEALNAPKHIEEGACNNSAWIGEELFCKNFRLF